MIDLERQKDIERMVRAGKSYKEALISMNAHIKVPFGIVKDEVWDIVESSWGHDFNERFPHLVEAYFLLNGFSLPEQPDWSTDEP